MQGEIKEKGKKFFGLVGKVADSLVDKVEKIAK